ncbi:hypothetical protein [Fundicoccus culcitae]|uniref:Polyhydroxyalkanoate synthesis regulator phasin n=1 Tax=Fundicoccus culcitae TaxID=2969821 RepID=A0ABY5P6Y4_9LACT|nr:hypothetical protein [Fundicoccus culcitae]UUX34360.1 hypothetical protein NRE15_01540 [Fundicoccus culcitae]
MERVEKSIKNIFLAAVGGTALSYEKAEDLVNKMIEKGQVTVKEGKELTEDLTRTIKGEHKVSEDSEQAKMELAEELMTLRLDINEIKRELGEIRKRLSEAEELSDI